MPFGVVLNNSIRIRYEKCMNEQLVKNSFNQWIYVDPGDYIGKRIIRHGLYDSSSINFMRSLLEKLDSPVVIDIGANIGNHLLPILPLVKKAIAFEPQPKTFDKLNRSVEKNKFTNCTVENFGLGSKDEELPFYENVAGNNGSSSFVKEKNSDNTKIVPNLLIKNGDSVIDELSIDKLDFIKIDVEGFEYEVFKGIEKNIKKYSPVILMEWDASTTGKDFLTNDVFNTILSDYQVFVLEEKYPWWVRNKLWSIRNMVGKSVLEKYEVSRFDQSRNHNNIVLFKEEHRSVLTEVVKTEIS